MTTDNDDTTTAVIAKIEAETETIRSQGRLNDALAREAEARIAALQSQSA